MLKSSRLKTCAAISERAGAMLYPERAVTGKQDVGDIEVSEWKMLMKDLIRRSDEEFLYKLLFQWVSQTTPWLHTKQEYELQALELHAMRIFENPDWADYDAFRGYCRSLQTGGDLNE